MSLFNVTVSPVRAIIVTDTAAFSGDGTPLHFTSKAFVLGHLGAVVADVGTLGVAYAFQREANHLALPRGLDDLLAAAPAILRRVVADMPHAPVHGTCVAGWSEVRRRIVAVLFTNQDAQGFAPVEVQDGHLGMHPAVPGVAPRGRRPELPDLTRHAEAQQAEAERLLGFRGVGGELVALTVTRSSIESRVAYRFADYDAMAATMAARRPAQAAAASKDPVRAKMELVARKTAAWPPEEREQAVAAFAENLTARGMAPATIEAYVVKLRALMEAAV
jgi:hypothetical protein